MCHLYVQNWLYLEYVTRTTRTTRTRTTTTTTFKLIERDARVENPSSILLAHYVSHVNGCLNKEKLLVCNVVKVILTYCIMQQHIEKVFKIFSEFIKENWCWQHFWGKRQKRKIRISRDDRLAGNSVGKESRKTILREKSASSEIPKFHFWERRSSEQKRSP